MPLTTHGLITPTSRDLVSQHCQQAMEFCVDTRIQPLVNVTTTLADGQPTAADQVAPAWGFATARGVELATFTASLVPW
ncbi:hypothetical protein [Allorhodopirellula heiligendammensis]|uniref:hypothetical protein n=1 Tax=Allorhodopirellula heiligendammensis TaxID=2714739 RepID=UPI0011B65B6F|nr:hypothetical protein [Allorhodopirellula heiligendammensis]